MWTPAPGGEAGGGPGVLLARCAPPELGPPQQAAGGK